VKLYVEKGGFKGKDGKMVVVPLSEVNDFVEKKLGVEDKLSFLGEKTIARMGCFGCHNIPGFENAKPIGTPLYDWGLKNPARLDFGHITEYIEDQPTDDHGTRDGTPPYFLEELGGHTRIGFLYQKLHRPRSYDYLKKSEKYKTWDDRLRMPRFSWANDPDAIEEIMTFILGLTGEKVSAKYVAHNRYNEAKKSVAQGAKVLNRFNCAGCHVLEMPKFTIPAGTKVAEAFSDFKTNLRSSYTSRGTDYLKEFYPGLAFDADKKLSADQIEASLGIKPDDGSPVTIEGMPTGLFENELSVQLWQPVTIRGYTFNVGDTVTLDQTKIQKTPAVGGDFAWLYSTFDSERTGKSIDTFWNRLPPPLLREGNKVQTPWLMSFLKDPYAIRPAAQLRMPRFHYGKSETEPSRETEELSNYFAARDHAEFPYQAIPERTNAYLSSKEKEHSNYLSAGWTMMANKASPCIQCHAIGTFKPTGGAEVVNGPDLRQVGSRFRPGFLETWIANPRRLVPYTAMPQNVGPHGKIQIPVPKEFEGKSIDVVRAIRDTLLNYINAVEQQLVSTKPDANQAAMNSKNGGGGN
jgi:mono/diheme cytochrome c family protein